MWVIRRNGWEGNCSDTICESMGFAIRVDKWRILSAKIREYSDEKVRFDDNARRITNDEEIRLGNHLTVE